MRLLLVDDDPRILTGLSRALRSSGLREWDVATATSGDEALAQLALLPADVVVSDVKMPGMDGPALLGEVRRRWPDAVRLVLSGYADTIAAQRLTGVAHQFMEKPLRVGELVDLLRRVERLRARFANPAFRALIGGAAELPAAPALYVELSGMVEDPHVTLDQLAAVVRKDPAVAAKVLQLASSAFFARGGPTADLREAIGRIGSQVVRMVALAAGAFRPPPQVAAVVDRLQARGLAAAVLAQELVDNPEDREAAFVSGLLADLGMTGLLTWMPDRYLPLVRAAGDPPLHVREVQEFGVSHADVGAYLLGLWGLPRIVLEAVSCHHDPLAVGAPSRDPILAAYLAHALLDDEPIDEGYLARAGCAQLLPRWRTLVRGIASCEP